MKVHKEGYNIIAVAFIIASAVVLGCYYLLGGWGVLTQIICVAALVIFTFVVRFFRVPKRTHVVDKDLVVAPCDGKVVLIQEVEENEYLKEKCLQVSIFMSVFNVHVNYYPVGGKVLYSKHHQGAYIVAAYPKASELNERTSIAVETASGTKVLFRQIAGYIARRIVCYAKEGDNAAQCSQVGFIKFGSRMDLFLPLGTELNVKIGDKTRACETVVAKLK
ncbi:MAG: phosphatidylserine decarboxylase family protein [Bacteroidales bacterium]|nr:phosphatidylserine decarboxylase family protein [Bacteroidales bacterium]